MEIRIHKRLRERKGKRDNKKEGGKGAGDNNIYNSEFHLHTNLIF